MFYPTHKLMTTISTVARIRDLKRNPNISRYNKLVEFNCLDVELNDVNLITIVLTHSK